MTGIVILDRSNPPDVSEPAPDRLLEGQPVQRVWNAWSDPGGQFHAGEWSSTIGKWRVRYTESELCVITMGRVVLTAEDGVRHEFGPGDAFVVPGGYAGTWEVVEDCTKIYAIFEPRT